jgi:hypothetical protein
VQHDGEWHVVDCVQGERSERHPVVIEGHKNESFAWTPAGKVINLTEDWLNIGGHSTPIERYKWRVGSASCRPIQYLYSWSKERHLIWPFNASDLIWPFNASGTTRVAWSMLDCTTFSHFHGFWSGLDGWLFTPQGPKQKLLHWVSYDGKGCRQIEPERVDGNAWSHPCANDHRLAVSDSQYQDALTIRDQDLKIITHWYPEKIGATYDGTKTQYQHGQYLADEDRLVFSGLEWQTGSLGIFEATDSEVRCIVRPDARWSPGEDYMTQARPTTDGTWVAWHAMYEDKLCVFYTRL